jgi:hypothetical protein
MRSRTSWERDMAMAPSAYGKHLKRRDHAPTESRTWPWHHQPPVSTSKDEITHILRAGHGHSTSASVKPLTRPDHAPSHISYQYCQPSFRMDVHIGDESYESGAVLLPLLHGGQCWYGLPFHHLCLASSLEMYSSLMPGIAFRIVDFL